MLDSIELPNRTRIWFSFGHDGYCNRNHAGQVLFPSEEEARAVDSEDLAQAILVTEQQMQLIWSCVNTGHRLLLQPRVIAPGASVSGTLPIERFSIYPRGWNYEIRRWDEADHSRDVQVDTVPVEELLGKLLELMAGADQMDIVKIFRNAGEPLPTAV